MTLKDFNAVWPILKRQANTLRLPWLEGVASSGKDPFKILISCILSLRTRDKVTEDACVRLFNLAHTPEGLSSLSVEQIETAIYPVGFYRVKSKRIKKISCEIVTQFDRQVPDTIEKLLEFEGVGRKTANLVVTLGYDKPGICVDTHVHRIFNRWGILKTRTPIQTEFTLRDVLPQRYWKEVNGVIVAFGQGICRPVSPRCSQCDIRDYCGKVGVVSRS
ncbi:MAG: endonuclease III domain-containing protein [Dissulfurispiraceae bacterium]